ncbi:MAG: pyruvate kinase [Oscillospiraceae bacterium]
MKKTKIVCTLGPSSNNEDTIIEMISNGMNVARLNFSHGDHQYHKATINTVKKVRDKIGEPIAIMLDTKGPEIRIKKFKDDSVILTEGDIFTLTTNDVLGTNKMVSVTFSKLPQQLKQGNMVLIDDGSIKLCVKECTDTDVICTVVRGGKVSNSKGINIPYIHIDMPYLSKIDKDDILFGIENDIDFIAASFVRNKEDIISLRKFIDYNGGHDIRIISKIENLEGIENFDDILKNSDGIMVARGDMGVEVEYERLPGLQKKFIKKCYQSGKMVITATQMLESMIYNPTPTRAEITDVANAVFDGTSAVMLSGETAMGKYPALAVKVMSKIAHQAELDAFEAKAYKGISYEMDTNDTTNAVCDAACTTAKDIKAKAIIALTKRGQTARRMSKFRPNEPIVAATPVVKTYHQLSLSWGVFPVLAKYQNNFDDLFLHATDCAKQIDVVADGDIVVIAAGIPLASTAGTNLLKVEIVGNKK